MIGWRRSRRKPAPDHPLEQELEFHIAELTESYIANGMGREEARRKALLEFGGTEQVSQRVRELHVSVLFEALRFNLRSAVRFLRKSPLFATAVVVTLALGIGANSAVFSAIDAVVLRPLPYPNGNQLVAIYQQDSKGRGCQPFCRACAP